jgi:hypothetical protein
MGIPLHCERADPIVTTLREVFGANILRIPEERIQPLTVLARRESKQSFRGDVETLFDDRLEAMPPETGRMADVSGKRTRRVDADVGLEILSGFLSGIGIESPKINAQFAKAQEVSFSFGDVERRYVEPGRIGKALQDKVIDRESPATAIFFGEDAYQLLLVDSVIISNQFTISVDKSSDASFKIDVPAIQQVVGDLHVGVKVSTATELDVSFHGEQKLTFAFTCQRLFVDENGRITQIDPNNQMLNAAAEGQEIRYVPDKVLLSSEPELVDLEPPEAVPTT